MYNKMFAIKKHFILLWDYVRCKNWHLFLIGKSWYLIYEYNNNLCLLFSFKLIFAGIIKSILNIILKTPPL